MVDALVILDGASEPRDDRASTSLERARTPALDALARTGALSRVKTVPDGLPAGSESAIPVLLGWVPDAPVDRARVEAAARSIAVPGGQGAWRVDVLNPDGTRAGGDDVARAAHALRAAAPAHAVHAAGGHRLLVVGPAPLPDAAHALHVWPAGIAVPALLDATTVMVAAPGACAGIARLLGAGVRCPAAATGGPDSDLRAKAACALAAMAEGARRVVVHVGGADEAAHARDAAGKVAFLERADRELVAPLAEGVRDAGGTLRVCPDHGCDPLTGAHDALPVPCLTWGADAAPEGACGARLTERAVAGLALTDLTRAVAGAAA